jgi:Uma2 family endonuclease
LLLNPTLIVEVLSKSTQKYDRSGKFDEYKTLPSFLEYVLVRQDICYVETRYREEPGLWRETVVTDPDGQVHLRSLGCSIPVKGIYKNVVFK